MSRFAILLALISGLASYSQDLNSAYRKAEDLYQHTDYQASLKVLHAISPADARTYCLMGRDYFMLGQFKPAVENFERAAALDPNNSDYALWLGRGWGRRAETASVFTAPAAAAKARQYFELAVKLDPHNKEATGDLFDYYLNAPGFLGGGLDKATQLQQHIAREDEAEGHFAAAQIADRRKQYDTAEQQLRRAVELAPKQVGRILDLARYLAKQGRVQESDAVFAQAEKIDPNSPKLLYVRAKTYVEEKRNLDQAKRLLEKYLHSNVTPEDPPKQEAQRLLAKASGV